MQRLQAQADEARDRLEAPESGESLPYQRLNVPPAVGDVGELGPAVSVVQVVGV